MTLYFHNQNTGNNDENEYTFEDANVNETYAVLRGFNPRFGDGEHNLKWFKARIKDVERDENRISYTAISQLRDDSQNTGRGDLNVTLIGKTADDPTQFESLEWQPGDGQVRVSATGQQPLQAAFVLVREIKLQFRGEGDHNVLSIVINTGNDDLRITQNEEQGDGWAWEVTFRPNLTMEDDQGNDESNSKSYMDLLVVFLPQVSQVE